MSKQWEHREGAFTLFENTRKERKKDFISMDNSFFVGAILMSVCVGAVISAFVIEFVIAMTR